MRSRPPLAVGAYLVIPTPRKPPVSRCPQSNQHDADKAVAVAAATAAVEERTAEKVKDAVSRAQRERHPKYRARVLEAAFAQLAVDNR